MNDPEFEKRLRLFKAYYKAIKIMQDLQKFCKVDMFEDQYIEEFFYHEINPLADDVAEGKTCSGYWWKRIEYQIDNINDWWWCKQEAIERKAKEEAEKKYEEEYGAEAIFNRDFKTDKE